VPGGYTHMHTDAVIIMAATMGGGGGGEEENALVTASSSSPVPLPLPTRSDLIYTRFKRMCMLLHGVYSMWCYTRDSSDNLRFPAKRTVRMNRLDELLEGIAGAFTPEWSRVCSWMCVKRAVVSATRYASAARTRVAVPHNNKTPRNKRRDVEDEEAMVRLIGQTIEGRTVILMLGFRAAFNLWTTAHKHCRGGSPRHSHPSSSSPTADFTSFLVEARSCFPKSFACVDKEERLDRLNAEFRRVFPDLFVSGDGGYAVRGGEDEPEVGEGWDDDDDDE
jgi:hypothetical protein